MNEQDEAVNYGRAEQEKSLLAMDVSREMVASNTAANLAAARLADAKVRVRLRLSGCLVALTCLALVAGIVELVRFG